MKVLVSNPFKQHTHQLCVALQKKGWLVAFYTTVWYKSNNNSLYRFTSLLLPFFGRTLRRRWFKEVDENLVKSYPFFEFIRVVSTKLFKLTSEKWVFLVERQHDDIVAKRIKNHNFDIIIGYEKSCLNTFQSAKEQNKITILDIAQVHFKHILELKDNYPYFGNALGNKSLREKIDIVKQDEYRYADYIFTISKYAQKTLTKNGIPEEKIRLLNLGFDPTIFQPKEAYRQEGEFKMLFVGSIMKRKGINLLIESFIELQLPQSSLTLVGPMADGKDIIEKYKGEINYIPFMHHEKLKNQYQEADIFIFPSYLDSWGMVVLEAMACGTPVIVSENTGSRDVVEQGGGFVVPVENKEKLKKRILKYYHDRKLIEEHGKLAVRYANKFTWEKYHCMLQKTLVGIYHIKNSEQV